MVIFKPQQLIKLLLDNIRNLIEIVPFNKAALVEDRFQLAFVNAISLEIPIFDPILLGYNLRNLFPQLWMIANYLPSLNQVIE